MLLNVYALLKEKCNTKTNSRDLLMWHVYHTRLKKPSAKGLMFMIHNKLRFML